MKKKVFVAAAIVACIAILGAGTLAYFSRTVVTHNVITSGEIDVSVHEQVPEGTEIRDQENKLTGYQVTGVMPDKTVEKVVWVTNDAQQPAWIRVQLTNTIRNKTGSELDNTQNGVDMVQYLQDAAHESKWKLIDGWYYYTEPLSPGAKTVPVLDAVYFAKQMGNDYKESTIDLKVVVQAVQSKNNPMPEGGLSQIPGWPQG